jgi:hypothetical protein
MTDASATRSGNPAYWRTSGLGLSCRGPFGEARVTAWTLSIRNRAGSAIKYFHTIELRAAGRSPLTIMACFRCDLTGQRTRPPSPGSSVPAATGQWCYVSRVPWGWPADHSCHILRRWGLLCQRPPAGRERPPTIKPNARVLRRDRLGGLIHEYAQVA